MALCNLILPKPDVDRISTSTELNLENLSERSFVL